MSNVAAETGSGRAAECVDAISTSVKAVVVGDFEAARVALDPIAGDVWAGMPPWQRPSGARERPAVATSGRRSFTPARAAVTFVRDGFRCRYCGQRLVPVCLMSVLSLLFPGELPYVSTYKKGHTHRAYWEVGAEADHIVPGTRGGSWTDPDNHATACALCNTRKSDWTLAELGWTLRPPGSQNWDGLVSLYRPLWECSGSPTAGNQRGWLRAFDAALSS